MDLAKDYIPEVEKRTKPRFMCNYPAIVRGFDLGGIKYEESACIINMSRGGAYALLSRSMQAGDVFSVRIEIPNGAQEWGTPKLSANAVVKRSEVKDDGIYGVAIEFQSLRFL